MYTTASVAELSVLMELRLISSRDAQAARLQLQQEISIDNPRLQQDISSEHAGLQLKKCVLENIKEEVM
mgnify:CR=1 FL=1